MRFFLSLLLCGFSVSFLFARATQYVLNSDFRQFEGVTLSNLSYVEGLGLRLSREVVPVYATEDIVWSMDFLGSDMLISMGETAQIMRWTQNKEGNAELQPFFSAEGHVNFGDVHVIGDQVFVSAAKDAALYVLDAQGEVLDMRSIPADFVWGVEAYQGKIYVFTGRPASLFEYQAGQAPRHILTLGADEHILRAKVVQGALLFATERTLYELDNDRAVAMARVDGLLTDFAEVNGHIFLSVSSEISGDTNAPSEHLPSHYGTLYQLMSNRTLLPLFHQQGMRFLSVGALGSRVVIGTDHRGAYFEWDIDNARLAYSSLGRGQFFRFLKRGKDIYAIMGQPFSILKMTSRVALSGSYTSDVMDTGAVSRWGLTRSMQSYVPGASIEILTSSGMTPDPSEWEEWKPLRRSWVQSEPARYLRYRVEFRSKGTRSPTMYSFRVPYMQDNVPPRVSDLASTPQEDGTLLSWQMFDVNQDPLTANVYLSRNAMEWVRVTQKPITDSNWTLSRYTFPDGTYRARVDVSDYRGNSRAHAAKVSLSSAPFVVDSSSPRLRNVAFTVDAEANKQVTVSFTAVDALTPISYGEYSINGGEWLRLDSVDGMGDALEETFRFQVWEQTIPFFVSVRAFDDQGNMTQTGFFVREGEQEQLSSETSAGDASETLEPSAVSEGEPEPNQ